METSFISPPSDIIVALKISIICATRSDVLFHSIHEKSHFQKVLAGYPKSADIFRVANNNSPCIEPGICEGLKVAHVVLNPRKGYGKSALRYDWITQGGFKPDLLLFLWMDYVIPDRIDVWSRANHSELNPIGYSVGHSVKRRGWFREYYADLEWLATNYDRYIQGARFADLASFRAITMGRFILKWKLVDENSAGL